MKNLKIIEKGLKIVEELKKQIESLKCLSIAELEPQIDILELNTIVIQTILKNKTMLKTQACYDMTNILHAKRNVNFRR